MELLTLKQLRELKNLSRYEAYLLIKMGMPHYRFSRNIKVDPQEFNDWFQRFKREKCKIEKTDLDEIINSSLAEAGIS